MLTFISCKHSKHTTMKKSINPWPQMIPTLNKIIEKLQQITKIKFPRKGTICKNKWNYLNFDYNFFVDHHKRTMNHTCDWDLLFEFTTTTNGYFAIHISSQTTKKEAPESSHLRTIIPRKLLTFCDTITFAHVQSQVLHNSRTWYHRKTFPIITASIYNLRFTLHRKLCATNPSPQRLSELTQKPIGFRYKIYRKLLAAFWES